mgnify:CR=1 FL=1
MWIVMNNSFVSVVQDRNFKDGVVVRARFPGDLDALFPEFKNNIIESANSDYRFRLFLNKTRVKDRISEKIMGINYDNFKNSVKENWRHDAYLKVWNIFYLLQHKYSRVIDSLNIKR